MDWEGFGPPFLRVHMANFHILDTETASLQGGVVELAYLEVDADLNVLSEFCSHVNPERPIDPGAQKVHGITDEMVKDAPTLAEVASHFTGPIEMIAHNAHFDRRMIQPTIQVGTMLCTLKMARALIKGTTNFKLETLQTELKLPVQKSHSALGDVHTVRDLLLHMREHCGMDLKQYMQAASVPSVVHLMPFGKYQGKPLTAMPASYRSWLLQQELDPNLKLSLERLKGL